MEAIQNAAFVSVGRACGFAALAVVLVVLGLSFAPVHAMRTGGLLCLSLTAVLIFRALTARRWPYERTETWLILSESQRPPAQIAQMVIGEILRETFFRFAQHSAIAAAGLLAVSASLKALGFGGWDT